MQTQWLLRECFSVILDGELHSLQLSQLVSTIPVSVGINYLPLLVSYQEDVMEIHTSVLHQIELLLINRTM